MFSYNGFTLYVEQVEDLFIGTVYNSESAHVFTVEEGSMMDLEWAFQLEVDSMSI